MNILHVTFMKYEKDSVQVKNSSNCLRASILGLAQFTYFKDLFLYYFLFSKTSYVAGSICSYLSLSLQYYKICQ